MSYKIKNNMKGDFYHIVNRGVEEREIFHSDSDYLRFSHNISDFNSEELALPYPIRRYQSKTGNIGHRMSNKKDKDKIVDLLCWCLMPNHVHAFAQAKIDAGASIFSKKIFGGYTKYINEIKKRKGVLFQGRSKIIPVEKDGHFFHLPYYIMSNPVSLIEPSWREKGIANLKKAINFLENYRWSSYLDIIGKSNFPEIIDKALFYELFETNEEKFKKDFIEWLSEYKIDPDQETFVD